MSYIDDEIPRFPHIAFLYGASASRHKNQITLRPVQTTKKMKMLMLRTLARAVQSSRRSNVWRTYDQLRNSSSIAPVNGTNGTGVSISVAEVYQGRSWMPRVLVYYPWAYVWNLVYNWYVLYSMPRYRPQWCC